MPECICLFSRAVWGHPLLCMSEASLFHCRHLPFPQHDLKSKAPISMSPLLFSSVFFSAYRLDHGLMPYSQNSSAWWVPTHKWICFQAPLLGLSSVFSQDTVVPIHPPTEVNLANFQLEGQCFIHSIVTYVILFYMNVSKNKTLSSMSSLMPLWWNKCKMPLIGRDILYLNISATSVHTANIADSRIH